MSAKRLFKIPRNIPESAKPYWTLVRKHGRSYASMVRFICNIGGYYDRGDRYAIEFSVKAHNANSDVDHLWQVASTKTDFAASFDALPFVQKHFMEQSFRTVYKENEEHVFSWGLEEAAESWRDSDVPYETWLGERVDWSFEFHGRFGGHLCMTECAGINLESTNEDLYERLMEKIDGAYNYSVDDVRRLFIICVQNTVELTTQRISEEVDYRMAWRLYTMAEGTFSEVAKYHEERDELRESAELIGDYLAGKLVVEDGGDSDAKTAFEKICALAGVTLT